MSAPPTTSGSGPCPGGNDFDATITVSSTVFGVCENAGFAGLGASAFSLPSGTPVDREVCASVCATASSCVAVDYYTDLLPWLYCFIETSTSTLSGELGREILIPISKIASPTITTIPTTTTQPSSSGSNGGTGAAQTSPLPADVPTDAPSASPSVEPSPGLSTGAQAGIGVGAAAGGLLLLGAVAFFIVRRRRANRSVYVGHKELQSTDIGSLQNQPEMVAR